MMRRRIQTILRGVRRFFRAHYEQLRTLLLLVLIVGVCAQSRELWLRAMDDGLGSGHTTGNAVDSSACAMPVRFAARADGAVYGIQYNTNGMQQAYDRTADVWMQALENAGKPTLSNTARYRAALKRDMLLMDYDGSVPLYALAGWLDCELPEQLETYTLGTIALSCGDNFAYSLYLRDGQTGRILEIPTSVDTTAFSAAVGQFEPNDCVLAADEKDAGVSPDTLYFPGGETFEVVSFDAYDGADGWENILTAFGLDAESAVASVYTAEDARVYVSGSHTVRLAGDGTMRYDGSTIHVGIGDDTQDVRLQCIQSGYELTGTVLDAMESGASVSLIKAYEEQDTGRYIAVFGLQIGGVPVDNDVSGYFARYEFENDVLVRATLALRTSQTTGETIAVMPEKQVAATMDAAVDAQLSLRYTDEARGTNWAVDDDDASLWDDEQTQDGMWLDELDEADADDDAQDEDAVSDYGTSWYDSTGTPVSPMWYALHYDNVTSTADSGNTAREDREIEIVRADFDQLIRGGGAA